MPDVAAGKLWIALTYNNSVIRVDPATGRIAGPPISVDTGTCSSSSVVDGDIWYSSVKFEDWPCKDATRRISASTGAVSPVIYAPGKPLEDVVKASGAMWATDKDRTLYRLDIKTAALQPALTFDEHSDSNRLVTAFGSVWVLRDSPGRLLRLSLTVPDTGKAGSAPPSITGPTATRAS
jgi:streptogramin lyase